MKLHISLSTPRGAPEGADIEALKEQISREAKSFEKPVTEKYVPAAKNRLGDFAFWQWIIENWDQIVDVAKQTAAMVQALSLTVRALLPDTKETKSLPAPPPGPQVQISIQTDSGEIRIIRNLPVPDSELPSLQQEIEEHLRKSITQAKR